MPETLYCCFLFLCLFCFHCWVFYTRKTNIQSLTLHLSFAKTPLGIWEHSMMLPLWQQGWFENFFLVLQ